MNNSASDATVASALNGGYVKTIAFVNFKSGGRKGKVITNILKQEIGHENVFNLAETNPEKVLLSFANEFPPHSLEKPSALHAIACGGDGTVNWLLSTISLHSTTIAHLNVRVGILPLGTGNDTSRFFGWGKKISSDVIARRRLRKMASAACPSRPFDRWTVVLTHKDGVSMHPLLDRMPIIDSATYSSLCDSGYVHESLRKPTPIPSSTSLLEPEMAESKEAHPQDIVSTSISHIVDSPELSSSKSGSGSGSLLSPLSEAASNQSIPQNQSNQSTNTSLDLDKSSSRLATETLARDVSITIETIESNLDSDNSPLKSQCSQMQNSPKAATSHSYIHRLCSFNNYFSFGIDAQIMASFHHQREACSWLFCCRCCTMTWVGLWSPLNCCLSCGSIPLHLEMSILKKMKTSSSNDTVSFPESNSMSVERSQDASIVNSLSNDNLDGRHADALVDPMTTICEPLGTSYAWVPCSIPQQFLDDQSAIVLLNIPSYAGGRDIWGTQKEKAMRQKLLKSSQAPDAASAASTALSSGLDAADTQDLTKTILEGPSSVALKKSDRVNASLPASISDGLLEFCSFDSYLHMNNAVLEVFGSRSTRLDQVMGLRIAINGGFAETSNNISKKGEKLPGAYIQMDGEAWVQDSGYIELIRAPSVQMLWNDDPSLE